MTTFERDLATCPCGYENAEAMTWQCEACQAYMVESPSLDCPACKAPVMLEAANLRRQEATGYCPSCGELSLRIRGSAGNYYFYSHSDRSVRLGGGPRLGPSAGLAKPPKPPRSKGVDQLMIEARLFTRYGLTEQVVESLRTVLEIAPAHAEAQALLAKLEREDG